ncbi:MAG: phytanoyl-CoA dioxygenase family protein [Planctomycetes bacterium]|nr:phytanoyl-CoA dioxygenase family protein [Planctomycetota bacterium]
MQLTDPIIRAFRTDGVVMVANVLSDQSLRKVVAGIEAWVDERADELRAQGQISDAHRGAPFERRMALLHAQCPDMIAGLDIMHSRIPALFEFLHDEILLDAVESLIGPEITCSPIQHLRAKMPAHLENGGNEMVPWHQDAGVTLEDADATDIVTCWIPLVDASRANGCMEVMPGARALGHLPHVSLGGTTIRPDLLPSITPVAAECPRGGVVFLDKFTPHRGLPNTSDTVRWTLDLRFQRTGTSTGRPFHPAFPVRSRDASLVRRDHADWCRRWCEALESSRGRQTHRLEAYVG